MMLRNTWRACRQRTSPRTSPSTGMSRQRAGTQGVHRRRTTRLQGYSLSQGKRKMIECMFGWGKQHGTMRKTKYGLLESPPAPAQTDRRQPHPHPETAGAEGIEVSENETLPIRHRESTTSQNTNA